MVGINLIALESARKSTAKEQRCLREAGNMWVEAVKKEKEESQMTHDFKAAMDALDKIQASICDTVSSSLVYYSTGQLSQVEYTERHRMLELYLHNCDTIRATLQLAQEAEQLRSERDKLAVDRFKLADALLFLQSTVKFNHPIMELAKKVSAENGNY